MMRFHWVGPRDKLWQAGIPQELQLSISDIKMSASVAFLGRSVVPLLALLGHRGFLIEEVFVLVAIEVAVVATGNSQLGDRPALASIRPWSSHTTCLSKPGALCSDAFL